MLLPLRRRALLGAACAAPFARAGWAQDSGPGLGEIARRHGIGFGCAVHASWLQRDRAYAAAVAREAALLVPEGEGKWDSMQPREGRFTTEELEPILRFATANGQEVRGHTLVWHTALPRWVWADTSPANAEGRLVRHIEGVLAVTRGRIRDWDVVNEPVADPDVLPGQDLRDSVWYRALGRDYLPLCFRTARAADPGVRLVLNDYGLEASWARADEKRARMLRLIRFLIERGAKPDALGIQAHMPLDQPFSPGPFGAFLREVRGLGLDILLTELDVIEPENAQLREEDIPARDAAVAERAYAVTSTAIEAGCRTVLTWGLSDPFSWLNHWPPARRKDGAEVRALPLDNQHRRKPMWDALARAFAGGAPPG